MEILEADTLSKHEYTGHEENWCGEILEADTLSKHEYTGHEENWCGEIH